MNHSRLNCRVNDAATATNRSFFCALGLMNSILRRQVQSMHVFSWRLKRDRHKCNAIQTIRPQEGKCTDPRSCHLTQLINEARNAHHCMTLVLYQDKYRIQTRDCSRFKPTYLEKTWKLFSWTCFHMLCGMVLNESYLNFHHIAGVVAENTQCSLVWHGVNWGLARKWSNLGWRQRLKTDNEAPPVRNLIEHVPLDGL